MASPTKPRTHLSQHLKKYRPIDIIEKNILAPITPRSQVIQRASKLDAKRSGHVRNLRNSDQ